MDCHSPALCVTCLCGLTHLLPRDTDLIHLRVASTHFACVWPQVMNLTGLAIFGHHHHGVACEHAHGHSHGHSEAEEKGHGAAGVRARGYSQVCTPTEEGYLQTGRTEGT